MRTMSTVASVGRTTQARRRLTPDMEVSDAYAAAWRRLRAVRAVLLSILFGGVPVGVVLLLLHVHPALFFIPWATAVFVAIAFVGLVRCPRCGYSFTAPRVREYPFTNRCVQCGLRVGSPEP